MVAIELAAIESFGVCWWLLFIVGEIILKSEESFVVGSKPIPNPSNVAEVKHCAFLVTPSLLPYNSRNEKVKYTV